MSKPSLTHTPWSGVCEEIDIQFPTTDGPCSQDQEYCHIILDGVRKKIRLHDYDRLFSIPGLYEHIFYDHLECCSPEVVCHLLRKQLEQEGMDTSELSILEIGAGNGMVGEELRRMGACWITGTDILIEAKLAAFRDRPDIYDDYLVVDLTDIPDPQEQRLHERSFNALVSVAALGFGDLPPLAYANAFNFVEDDGWIAFNIKDKFLSREDSTGFSELLHRMREEEILHSCAQVKYRHRLSINHAPLNYIAIVGHKTCNIPESWLYEF